MKRTALRPVSAKRARHLRVVRDEPGREEFKRIWMGVCSVCGAPGLVRRHHVCYEQAVRRANGNPWDLRNAMTVGLHETCACHSRQHTAVKRIPLAAVPTEAIEFAVELLGQFNAAVYLASHYEGEME